MAPGLTESLPTPPHQLGPIDRNIFPDGLKTTGQHPPLYDQLQPFEKFPKEISGPTVWKAEEYRDNPEKWTHRFTDEEIEELSTAADNFIASKTPLTGISKVCNSFLTVACSDAVIRTDLVYRATSRSRSWGNSCWTCGKIS